MLSILFASILVHQSEPEPKLELKVFEDFALGLVGDSGYRIEMDKRIGDRPVVFYLGHRGDGVKDLIRACQDLDLGCYADPEMKKIFVNGPLASVDLTYREKIRQSIIKSQSEIRKVLEMSPEQVSDRYRLLHKILGSSEISKPEMDRVHAEINIIAGLMDQEDRVLTAQLLDTSPADLANKLDQSDGNPIQVTIGSLASNEWQKLLSEGLSPMFSADQIARADDEDTKISMEADNLDRAEKFQTFLKASPDVEIWFYAGEEGNVDAYLRLVTDDNNLILGRTWYRSFSTPIISSGTVRFEQLTEAFQRLMENPKHQIIPGIVTLNSIAEDCFTPKDNSVSWLMNPEYSFFGITSDVEYLPGLHAKLSEDRWLRIYSDWSRYPNFCGNWKTALELLDLSKGKELTFEELSAWLATTPPLEVSRTSAALGKKNISVKSLQWLEHGLLVQSAVLELQEKNSTHFSSKVSDLSLGAQRSIYQFFESESVFWDFPSLRRPSHRKQWPNYVLAAEHKDSQLTVEFTTSLSMGSGVKQFQVEVPLAESP